MASKLITLPFRPTINLRGGVEAGAKLFVYSTGTTTPVSVYSDSALSTPLTNPVVADAFGVFPDVYYNDTQIVRVVIQQANGTVLSDTDPYVSDAASAEASADAAALSAAAAEAVARPIYANNAAGLAATTEGDFFFVDQGDGTADLYRHDAGPTATAMSRTTIIDPQGSGAAGLIGYTQGGTGASARTVQDKLRDELNVADFLTDAEIADIKSGAMTIDVTAKLQAALDQAISQQATLRFFRGKYRTSASLIIGSWNGTQWNGFASVGVQGPTRSYGGSLGAEINCTAVDVPAVIIQNGRGIFWKDVAVLGPNYRQAAINADQGLMKTLAGFDAGTCRDSRYSPQAGICIDPFGTSVPADGGYPGLTAYYTTGASGSSDIQIDALIYDHIVGVMVTPNQVTQNAENIDISRCRISYCKYGVAVGQSQSRNILAAGVSTSFCGICYDGKTFGRQQGVMPHLYSANVSGRWFMNFSPAFGTPAEIHGLHAENLFSLGSYYGPASTNSPIVFIQPYIKFADFNGSASGAGYPDAHFVASHEVIFVGGIFTVDSITPSLSGGCYRFYAQRDLVFKGTTFDAIQNENPLYRSTGVPNLQNEGLVFDNCYLAGDAARGQSSGRSLFTSKARVFGWAQLQYCPTTIDAEYTFQDNAARSRNRYWNSEIINDTYRLISATQAITVSSAGVGTMTVPDGTLIRTGDAIVSITSFTPEGFAASTWNPLGIVSSVVGNDVTFVGVPQNIASGTYNIYHQWTPRLHNQSTGDTTSGSADIANVTNPTTWKVGHRIKGTGIPTGAYVTAVSGTTVTISKAATATNTNVRLFDANIYTVAGSAY